jgi:hypothetical protein
MKKIIRKIGDWWWLNVGFHHYMHKLEKYVKKNLIVLIYTDVD